MNTTLKIVYVVTGTLLALASGLFYAYSCSVNTGLANLTDIEYLRAMQSINVAIINPLFFLSFMGSLFMLPIATWMTYRAYRINSIFYLLLTASAVYAIGVMGVTMFGNVPLNQALASFDVGNASFSDMATQRAAFETPWNTFHSIRTIANFSALVIFLWAVIKK